MCGNREDAEDIVQKTFIQAFTKINGFREESSIYTWLFSIAKNLCLRQLEGKRKSSFASLEQLLSSEKMSVGPDDFTAYEKQFYIGQVKEGCLLGLLRCLSFYQRTAFILNILLEMKVKDVAEVINKSETATRVLVHRAKQNLKNFLCKNCSIYDAQNTCRCENLIHFSLKQGWIQKAGEEINIPKQNNIVEKIETEINYLQKITRIYSELDEDRSFERKAHIIQEEIKSQSLQIFSNKKVK